MEMVPFTARGCQNNTGTVIECRDDLCCPDGTGQRVPQFKSLVEYWFESCGQCKICTYVFCDTDLVPVVVPVSAIK